MSTLHQIYNRSKRLRKKLGTRMKSLAKKAKRVSRGKAELSDQEIREQLSEFREKTREAINLESTRALEDDRQRVNLVVDGEILIEDASVPLLLALQQEIKYQQRMYRRVVDATDDDAIDDVYRRLEALRDGLEAAIAEANNQPVELSTVGDTVDEYLFSGTGLGGSETA